MRVEALDGQFLYAIRIYSDPDEGFNLCPADICQVPGDEGEAPQAQGARKPLRIERADPPAWVVDAVLRIFAASGIDIGGVEYLESARDGAIYLYDVNSLSNFVTDAPALVGFDPFARFADYLERRLAAAERPLAAAAR